MNNQKIKIQTTVKASVEKVWKMFTTPNDIMLWNTASPDWHTTAAENDLNIGGKFSYTMAAKDGSFSFDFSGTYTSVDVHETIKYTLDDDRKVEIKFSKDGSETHIEQWFYPEAENSTELQQAGWQAILNNFKHYVEID